MDEFAELLRQAQQGSPEAAEALLRAHAPRLLAFIRLRMGPTLRARMESRDILQESLLKAYRSLDGFQGRQRRSFVAWLARVAANEIADQRAFHGRQRRDAGLDAPLDEDVVAQRVRSLTSRVALGQQARRVEAAMESLDAHYREIIVLRKLQELSYKEIGQQLDRSGDACRMLFARAMAALTLALEDRS